MHESDDNRER